jgi:hypothetical protein
MAGVWEKKEGTSWEVERLIGLKALRQKEKLGQAIERLTLYEGMVDMWVTAKVVARSVMGVVVEEGGFRACGDGGWGGGGSGV